MQLMTVVIILMKQTVRNTSVRRGSSDAVMANAFPCHGRVIWKMTVEIDPRNCPGMTDAVSIFVYLSFVGRTSFSAFVLWLVSKIYFKIYYIWLFLL